MADEARCPRGTVTVGGVEYEVEASNGACVTYWEENRDSCEPPFTGNLMTDILSERQSLLADGVSFPIWAQCPHVLCAIWAMAKAAGSVKGSFKTFRNTVDKAGANMYEASSAFHALFDDDGFGARAFFRLPDGFGDPGEPDTEG
ncbi:hypothetical protein AAK967_00175 [Atopobiaceae bacterium 24-176]